MADRRRLPVGDPLLKPATAPPPPPPPPAGKRRHAAKTARFGALMASCASTAGLTYFFANAHTGAGVALGAAPPSTAGPVRAPATPQPATAATTVPPAIAPPTTAGAPASAAGAFDGTVVNTRFGPVQVQAKVRGGRLVDVAIEQYPNEARRSERISEIALPMLQQESIATQSANVDTISGATYTSDGYSRSLQSALDQARAAGALA